jgi:hypothetical protein
VVRATPKPKPKPKLEPKPQPNPKSDPKPNPELLSLALIRSREEDEIILQSVDEFGPKWLEIAARLPGRTDHAARNRYHRLQRCHRPADALAAGGGMPETLLTGVADTLGGEGGRGSDGGGDGDSGGAGWGEAEYDEPEPDEHQAQQMQDAMQNMPIQI